MPGNEDVTKMHLARPAYRFKICEGHRRINDRRRERGKRTFLGRRRLPRVSCTVYTVASLAYNVLKIIPRSSLTLPLFLLSFSLSLSLCLCYSLCREIIVVYLRYPFSDLCRLLNCLDGVAENAPKRPRGIPERAASWLLFLTDDVPLRLERLVIPGSGIKRKGIKQERRIRTLFKSYVDPYLGM